MRRALEDVSGAVMDLAYWLHLRDWGWVEPLRRPVVQGLARVSMRLYSASRR